jgi:hypothetical protein
MIGLNIIAAINNWFQSRRAQGQNPDPNVVHLMLLMYKTLDALYLKTTKLPFAPTPSGANKKKPKDHPDAFTFGLWLNDTDYVTLRSILALVGDLIHISHQLTTLQGLAGLGQFISNLYTQSNEFRDARNFFIHMDEHLSDRQKHGITGPIRLRCSVEFTANATNNVYLIWDKDTLYFSRLNKPNEIVIDKPAFEEIFNQARQLYAEITNNPISQQAGNVMRPGQVYPP